MHASGEAERRALIEVMAHRVPTKDDLSFDPNPPEYLRMVKEFLEPAKPSFNYGDLLATYTTINNFLAWARIMDAHREVTGRRVLSSGCGNGASLVAYHALGAAQVVGTEVDRGFVVLSTTRTQGLTGVEVVEIDPTRPMPFADGSFDLIESLDVVEHVDDPVAYMRELDRVLAPGGTMLVAVPNRRYPVEQHTGVPGVPWLPLRVADALCGLLVKLPGLRESQRQRLTGVLDVRTGNYAWRDLERLAAVIGTTIQRVHRADHATYWPAPAEPTWVEWWSRQQRTAGLAPTKQLVAILRKPPHPD